MSKITKLSKFVTVMPIEYCKLFSRIQYASWRHGLQSPVSIKDSSIAVMSKAMTGSKKGRLLQDADRLQQSRKEKKRSAWPPGRQFLLCRSAALS